MTMNKRILFIIAGVALLASGFIFRGLTSRNALAQAKVIESADLAGNPDAATKLELLKSYASIHMGAGLTLTLEGSYKRAVAVAQAQAAAAGSSSKVYADAQAACAGKSDSVTQARCNQTYLSQHLTTAQGTPVAAPRRGDYQITVKSPIWTPDLAGALLLGSLAAFGFAAVTALREARR